MNKFSELGVDDLTEGELADLGINEFSEFAVDELSKTNPIHDNLKTASLKDLTIPKFRRNRDGIRIDILRAAANICPVCAEEVLRLEGLEVIN